MQIKVISINIWLGGKLFPELVSFLTQEAPDVVLMQEVYNGPATATPDQLKTLHVLQERLPQYNQAFGAAFMSERYAGIEMGNAILSRFPIVAHDTTFFDIPYGVSGDSKAVGEHIPRNVVRAQLDIGSGRSLHAFSTHGIWLERDGGDTPRRIEMGKTLARVCGGVQPAILAGDFNTWANTETIRSICAVMHDVFGTSLQSTFNLQIKTDAGFANAAVDHMFVSRDIRVVSAACPTVEISDHLPLVVTVDV